MTARERGDPTKPLDIKLGLGMKMPRQATTPAGLNKWTRCNVQPARKGNAMPTDHTASAPSTRASQDPHIAFMMRALDLPSHAYKLAGLLAWRYGSKGGSIFPSQATLARDLNTSPKTVQRMLRLLESIGLETEIRHGPDGKNNHSIYRFGGIVPDTTDLNSPIVPDTHVHNPASSEHLGPELRTFQTKVPDTTDPVTNRVSKRVTNRVRDIPDEEFESWWRQYPRRVAKGAAGNRGLGRPKGSRNKRSAAIREATERVNGGADLGPIRQFDSLERQREVASYFLSEAELEKAKAKPNKEQIARNLLWASKVLAEITPFERPKLTAIKVSGDHNLSVLSDEELELMRRLVEKAHGGQPLLIEGGVKSA